MYILEFKTVYRIYVILWISLCNSTGSETESPCTIAEWKSYDDRCYYFSNCHRNRTRASRFCEDYNGHLVTDANDGIHRFLKANTNNTNDEYWIGLHPGSTYYWLGVNTQQPNTSLIQNNASEGPCVISENGRWKYSSCNTQIKTICKKNTTNECDEYNTPWKPWQYFESYCYKLQAYTNTYTDGFGSCQAEQSYLTTILSDSEQDFLNTMTADPFWIGMSLYKWDDESTLTWANWGPLDTGIHDCVVLRSSVWNEESCSSNRSFICERSCGEHITDATTTHSQSTTITTSASTTITSTTTTSRSSTTITNKGTIPTTDLTSLYQPELENGFSTSYSTNEVNETDEAISSFTSTTFARTSEDLVDSSMSTVVSSKERITQSHKKLYPVLFGGLASGALVLVIGVVAAILCRRYKRKLKETKKGDYDASYEIAFSPNTEDKTRNSDSSLTDDEKLAQLRNRDSRVVIDSNVPDSEKIKPYLVTTIVDGHGEGQPSRRREVVSFIEDRVEYDNNNLDDLIVTDNDLYQSSVTDPNKSDTRPGQTDYDYAVRPPNPNQLSPGNVFINNAYDGEAEGGAVNHNQDAQIHYADVAFSTETLNKENTYADIDDFAPSLITADAKLPTTEGMDPRANTPDISNVDADSGTQAVEMKAIPVYAEVDANNMDKNKNEIIDDRKDAHDLEEGVNDMIVTDNDLYDFSN